MAQQTAVEWLIEQLVNLDKQLDGRRKSDDSTVIKLNPTKIYEQAKAMEKEQHGKTWDKSLDAYEGRGHLYVRAWEDFDEYYNETFTQGTE